jgi:hypothetical protein
MKRLFVAAAVTAGVVAIIGVLHMPFARGMLAEAGGCPFPTTSERPSLARADALRVSAAQNERGTGSAAAKPALGFALGQTTRAQVRAWARAASVTCEDDGIGLGVRCTDASLAALPGSLLSGSGQISFGFDLEEKLVSVSFLARVADTAHAESLRVAASSELEALGAPSRHQGEQVRRAFERRVDAWAYADYLGEVTTTHLGSGVVVAARHIAIPN